MKKLLFILLLVCSSVSANVSEHKRMIGSYHDFEGVMNVINKNRISDTINFPDYIVDLTIVNFIVTPDRKVFCWKHTSKIEESFQHFLDIGNEEFHLFDLSIYGYLQYDNVLVMYIFGNNNGKLDCYDSYEK